MKAEACRASYCSLETVSRTTSFLDGGQPPQSLSSSHQACLKILPPHPRGTAGSISSQVHVTAANLARADALSWQTATNQTNRPKGKAFPAQTFGTRRARTPRSQRWSEGCPSRQGKGIQREVAPRGQPRGKLHSTGALGHENDPIGRCDITARKQAHGGSTARKRGSRARKYPYRRCTAGKHA
jgi:hypothetical protein